VRAVVMVLRVRSRQYWKSWLALSLLVAVAGGFVLTTASAGHRTADAFPGFVARHGYDVIVYSGRPLPQLTRLPDVSSVTPVPVTYSAGVGCASCLKPIDTENFLVNEVPPGQLTRMVTLLSGRMPRPSEPSEVLASFTLAQENGIRVGSVLPAAAAGNGGTAGRGQGQTGPIPASGAAGGGHRCRRERVSLRHQPAL
jgi:hypothetical protein